MDTETVQFLANGSAWSVLLGGGIYAVKFLLSQIAEQKTEIKQLQERVLDKETDNEKKQNNMLRALIEMTHKDSKQLAQLVTNNTEAINRFNDSQNALIKAVENLATRVGAIEDVVKNFRGK